MFLSFFEAQFFRRLIIRQNLQLNFPSKEKFRNELLFMITEQTKERLVSPTLQSCSTCTVSFDLWISKENINTFILIVHFLNDKWELCRVIVRFFETINTSRNAMAIQVNNVFAKHGLNIHVLAYVKDEWNNLTITTFALTLIMSCEVLGLSTIFVGSYWCHAMFK